MTSGEQFGCAHCWPADADAAWMARSLLKRDAELIDESHFHVMILACGSCAQRFLSVFTEEVDWEDGDDPQYWTLLPITGEERARLSTATSEPELNRLGRGQRCLYRDHPKGEPARTSWGNRLHIRRHD